MVILDDMGMRMSLNQMDMNVVMYPEITGEENKKADNKMQGMDMSSDQYNSNALSDIVTLNYAMLKSPKKQHYLIATVKVLKFE